MRSKTALALLSESYVPRAIPFRLGTLDMMALYIVALFWINNAANAAAGGVSAIFYLLLGAAVFFIPCVLVTAQLGVIFPHDGSLYHWTYKALNRFWAMLVGFAIWLAGVLAIVGAPGTLVTYLQGLNPHWLQEPWQQGLVIIAVIAISALFACQRLPTIQLVVKIVVGLITLCVVLLVAAAIIWLATGHKSAADFTTMTSWHTTIGNYGLFGFITLLYLGTNIPLNMGGEISNRKVVTRHLLYGTIFVVVCYLLSMVAIMIIRGTMVSPFDVVTAVEVVFGKPVAAIVAICVLANFFISPAVYTFATARILLVAATDRCLPTDFARFVGKLNKHRAPVNAILLQSVISCVFIFLAFIVIPYLVRIGSPADLANSVYTISAAAVTIIWALATIFLFIDLLMIALRFPALFKREAIMPRVFLWASIFIGPLASLLAVLGTLFFSWIPATINNGSWLMWVGFCTLAVAFLTLIIVMVSSIVSEGGELWRVLESDGGEYDDFWKAMETKVPSQH